MQKHEDTDQANPLGSFDRGLHLFTISVVTWVKVFRITPEFRILRLTFQRKSASKC